jgi:hypothetical protein
MEFWSNAVMTQLLDQVEEFLPSASTVGQFRKLNALFRYSSTPLLHHSVPHRVFRASLEFLC